jgi:phosphopantetheinyl transferase
LSFAIGTLIKAGTREMEQIAERVFSVKQNAVFRTLPKSKRKEAFFNCWTHKEGFIKAIGNGLSHPSDKFDVSLVPGEPVRLLRTEGDSKAASHRWYALTKMSLQKSKQNLIGER